MRYLYLDDSGKVDPNHPSRVVMVAGLSVGHERWHAFVRQITGAKARFFPGRGHPARWELKGSVLLSPNAWQRRRNRDLCFELVEIMKRNDCRVYASGIEKRNSPRPLEEKWAVPLCFQAITAEFATELELRGTHGSITCDWSNYSLDHHVSDCVQTFVLRNRLLRVSGGVTYGSSLSLATIQVADVLACALRISAEGASHHSDLVASIGALRLESRATTRGGERGMLF